MPEENPIQPETASAVPPSYRTAQPAKKPYSAPVLTCYGDVRDITLGPSIGVGESGNPTIRRA